MFTLVRYLTHPQAQVDPTSPARSWGLSTAGHRRVQELVSAGWLIGTTQVVTSAERKALETAKSIAAALGVQIEVREGMHENDRSATGSCHRMSLKALPIASSLSRAKACEDGSAPEMHKRVSRRGGNRARSGAAWTCAVRRARCCRLAPVFSLRRSSNRPYSRKFFILGGGWKKRPDGGGEFGFESNPEDRGCSIPRQLYPREQTRRGTARWV